MVDPSSSVDGDNPLRFLEPCRLHHWSGQTDRAKRGALLQLGRDPVDLLSLPAEGFPKFPFRLAEEGFHEAIVSGGGLRR